VIPYSGVHITPKTNSKAVLDKETQIANKVNREDISTARGYNKKRR
jgi:hypothetical protein